MVATSNTAATPPYRRLPGKKKGFLVGAYHLWWGKDHLLQIYTRFGVEDYKRFYFADIQSVTLRKTANGRVMNLILAVLSALFTLFAASAGWGWNIFWVLLAGLFAILLLINWLRGPTCRTEIKTAVQTEPLHSLQRIKPTMTVMNQLAAKIQQVQGPVQPRQLMRQLPDASNRSRAPRGQRQTGRKSASQPLRRERGLAHTILFAMLLVDGIIVILNASLHMMTLTLISAGISVIILVTLIVALVRQDKSDMRQPLKRMTWAALGLLIVSFAFGYITSVVNTFKNPGLMQNQWHMLQYYTDISPFASPLMTISFVLTVGGAVFIGLPGLFLLNQHHKIPLNPAKKPNSGHLATTSEPI